MSTRCFFDFIEKNGTLRVYRCHDGYPIMIHTETKKVVGAIPDLVSFCEWYFYQPAKSLDVVTDFIRWNKKISKPPYCVELHTDKYEQENIEYRYRILLNHTSDEIGECLWLVTVSDCDDVHLFSFEVDCHGSITFLEREVIHD